MIWLVGIGGSFGAAVRFLLGDFISKNSVHPFPLATWIINVTGSFLLGFIVNLHLTIQVDGWLWYLVGIGFCGAFTTFSTFGYETVNLLQMNKIKMAMVYVIISVIVSIVFVCAGLMV
ncbi:fluoride efflux transporter CrcB [Virgibacillus ainsalahensis]